MKCKICGKEGARVRFKTKDIACAQCGSIYPQEQDKKKEGGK